MRLTPPTSTPAPLSTITSASPPAISLHYLPTTRCITFQANHLTHPSSTSLAPCYHNTSSHYPTTEPTIVVTKSLYPTSFWPRSSHGAPSTSYRNSHAPTHPLLSPFHLHHAFLSHSQPEHSPFLSEKNQARRTKNIKYFFKEKTLKVFQVNS